MSNPAQTDPTNPHSDRNTIVQYYTCGDIARLCGVTVRTVWNWVHKLGMPYHTTPGGHRRFHAKEVAEWFKSQDLKAPKELQIVAETQVLEI